MKSKLILFIFGGIIGSASLAAYLYLNGDIGRDYHPIRKNGAWDRIQERGMITVGVDPAYFPMEFVDKNGDLKGFDVDFANALGEKLGVRVNLKQFPMHYLMEVLLNLKIDAVISSFETTPHRQAYLSLVPYFNMPQSLVYPKDFKGDPWTKTIATETKSTIRAQMRKKLKPGQIRGYETFELMQKAYMDEDVDGFVVDSLLLEDLTPAVKKVSQSRLAVGYSQEIGIALHPMHDKLKLRLQAAVKSLQNEGFFEKMTKKWLEEHSLQL